MDFNWVDYGVATAFIGLMIYFAWLTRRGKDFYLFALGRKSIPTVLIFVSLSATYIGPGFSIGMVEESFKTGYFYLLMVLPFGIQTILVGLFLAPRLSSLNDCYSIGDVMAVKYGKHAQVLSGICSFAICIMFTGFFCIWRYQSLPEHP